MRRVYKASPSLSREWNSRRLLPDVRVVHAKTTWLSDTCSEGSLKTNSEISEVRGAYAGFVTCLNKVHRALSALLHRDDDAVYEVKASLEL